MTTKRKAAYQATKSGSYRTQIWNPLTGRRVSITAPTPLELLQRQAALNNLKREQKLGLRPMREIARLAQGQIYGNLMVFDVWDEWVKGKATRWAKQARSTWARRLAPTFGKLRAWEITEGSLVEWQSRELRYGFAQKTITNAFNCLASAYRFAVRSGKLDALPWGYWRPNRPVEREREACRSVEEFELLVRAAREHDGRSWVKGRYSDLAFRVLVVGLCGLRQGEAAALGWDCVQIDADPIHVKIHWQAHDGWQNDHPDWKRPQDAPKSGSGRTLALHVSAAAALLAQRKQLQDRGWYRPDGPVFPASGGAWRSQALVIDPPTLRRIVKTAGLPNPEKWVTHSLRHTFATLEVVAHGGDLRTVQRRTGHASLAVLAGYLHSTGRGLIQSAIRPLAAESIPQHTELSGVAIAPLELPEQTSTGRALVDLVVDTQGAEQGLYAAHQRKKLENRRGRRRREQGKRAGRKVAEFAEIAEQMTHESRVAGERPPEVTKAADEAYSRAYNEEMRKTGDIEKAAGAGRRARRARLGAWGKTLKVITRAKAPPGSELTPGVKVENP